VSAAGRVLAICADDFGLTPAISRGIVALAGRARLNAISCLTNGPHWPGTAAQLAGLPATIECGLHFNLTEGVPLSAELAQVWPHLPALPRLIVMAHLRTLPLPAIASEWQAQWRAFATATGAAPRFIDGHQHVHHLPGVREIVLDGAEAAGVAVRNTGCVLGPGDAFKRSLITGTGGRGLQRSLHDRGLAHNAALLGVYDFKTVDYRARMQQWLAAVPASGALLFCHPGATARIGEAGAAADPIAAARLREAAYLGSAEFAQDLAAADITLGSAWRRRSSGG
jgi:chitin disaccharide deacetylase